MPETTCAAPFCSRTGRHIFPKDKKRRDAWVHAIRRGKNKFENVHAVRRGKNKFEMWSPSKYSYLCEKHFTEDDYHNSSYTYVGTARQKRALKRTAVPSVFQWSCTETLVKNKERQGLFPLDLPSELPACKMEPTSSSSHYNSSRNYGDTIAATSAVTTVVPLNLHLSFVKTETGDLQCKRCHQRVSDINFIHEFQKHLETCDTTNLVVVTCVKEEPKIMEGIVHLKGLPRTDVNQKLTESDQASKDINSNLDTQFVKKEVLDHELKQDIESTVSIEPVNVTDTQFVKKEVLEHELKPDIESTVSIEPVNVTDTQFVKKEVLEHELKQDIESAVTIESVNVTDTQFVKKEVLEHELTQDVESAVSIEPINVTDTQFVKKEVLEQELKQDIESAVTIEPVNVTDHFAMNEHVGDTDQKIDSKTDSKEVYVSNTNNNCECDIDNTRGISNNFITSAISRENMDTACDSYGQVTITERNRNVNTCVDSENGVSDLENLGIKIELNEDFFED